MSTMGIRNKKGQMVLRFTCSQCNQRELSDFRFYPICNKCNKCNTKLQKREKQSKEKEKNS